MVSPSFGHALGIEVFTHTIERCCAASMRLVPVPDYMSHSTVQITGRHAWHEPARLPRDDRVADADDVRANGRETHRRGLDEGRPESLAMARQDQGSIAASTTSGWSVVKGRISTPSPTDRRPAPPRPGPGGRAEAHGPARHPPRRSAADGRLRPARRRPWRARSGRPARRPLRRRRFRGRHVGRRGSSGRGRNTPRSTPRIEPGGCGTATCLRRGTTPECCRLSACDGLSAARCVAVRAMTLSADITANRLAPWRHPLPDLASENVQPVLDSGTPRRSCPMNPAFGDMVTTVRTPALRSSRRRMTPLRRSDRVTYWARPIGMCRCSRSGTMSW